MTKIPRIIVFFVFLILFVIFLIQALLSKRKYEPKTIQRKKENRAIVCGIVSSYFFSLNILYCALDFGSVEPGFKPIGMLDYITDFIHICVNEKLEYIIFAFAFNIIPAATLIAIIAIVLSVRNKRRSK